MTNTARIHPVRNHARAARPRGAFGRATSNGIHFVGIGGIGMSALARWFRAQEWAVSGSDVVRSDITDALHKEGMRIAIGHKKGNISRNTAIVVFNRAISKDNPELLEAKKLNIPVIPYAKVFGKITEEYKTVAVTGSHGKSTTTALAGLALMRGGFDPTVFVGTNLKEFGDRNVHIGKNPWLVLEADDFGGAFWHYSPLYAIVTNIDREHLDFYKNFSGVKRGFLKFISRVRHGGTLIINRDDQGISNLKSQISKIAKKRDLKVIWYSMQSPAAQKIKKIMSIPGAHNVSNALAVYRLGKTLRIPEKKIITAFHDYHGSWRRMEYRGKLKIKNQRSKILVFDDYAHHPTEIKATLAAFREKYPNSPIICVFQPHQAARLEALFKEFQTAFTDADITLIVPVYNPAGRDKKDPKHDSAALVKAIQKKYLKKRIFYLADPKNLRNALTTLLENHPRTSASHRRQSAVLVMMGAGSIAEETKKLFNS